MLILFDANLAPRLAHLVSLAGHSCMHATEVLAPDASDIEIVGLANRLGATLITKDADFADLSRRGELSGALVWLKCGNMSNRETAARLVPALPRIAAAIEAGERIVEIR